MPKLQTRSPALADMVARWSDFTMLKQGELDYFCGVYCVIAAARRLETISASEIDGHLVELMGWHGKAIADGMPTKDIKKFIKQVGLKVPRTEAPSPVPQRIGEFVLSYVSLDFIDPAGKYAAYTGGHYVLALEGNDEHTVIADPHPWNPRVYPIYTKDLEQWYARSGERRWRGTLSK